MTEEDPIITSMAYLAASQDDVTPLLYERFVRRLPEAGAMMRHMDEHMLGRMMGDLLVLVMTPPDEIEPDYLAFEVSSHDAYGVRPEMFAPLLAVVRDAGSCSDERRCASTKNPSSQGQAVPWWYARSRWGIVPSYRPW